MISRKDAKSRRKHRRDAGATIRAICAICGLTLAGCHVHLHVGEKVYTTKPLDVSDPLTAEIDGSEKLKDLGERTAELEDKLWDSFRESRDSSKGTSAPKR